MPLIKIIGPYEFRFYSRGEMNEPAHIHYGVTSSPPSFGFRTRFDLRAADDFATMS